MSTSVPIPNLFARSLTAELLTLYCHLRVECGTEGWRWDAYSRVPSRSTFGSAAKRIARLTEDHRDHGTQCKRRQLRPVRPRDSSESLWGVPETARRGAALLQRAARLLRGESLPGHGIRVRRARAIHLREG